MTNRRTARRSRANGINARASAIANHALTALQERTSAGGIAYAGQIRPARRHNPFAGIGDRGLIAIQYAGLAVILGLGFGYLTPTITWPLTIPHIAAMTAIGLACAVSFLAIDRLTDNHERLTAVGRAWSIDATGVTVTEYDLKQNAYTLGFIAWSDVAMADLEDGYVILANAAGEVLAELSHPENHKAVLATIQRYRSERTAVADDAARPQSEPRLDPWLDLPETLDDNFARKPLHIGDTLLDTGFSHTRGRRIEPILPMPALPLRLRDEEGVLKDVPFLEAPLGVSPDGTADAVVIDADYIEILAPTGQATVPPQPYDADETIAHLEAQIPAEASFAVFENDRFVLDEDTRMAIFEQGYEPSVDASRIDLAVEETFRALFEEIPATFVPAHVAQQRAETVTPKPIDTTRVLSSNDDPIAQSDDAVLRRTVEQLIATAKERGLDPQVILEKGLQFAEDAEPANAAGHAIAARVA